MIELVDMDYTPDPDGPPGQPVHDPGFGWVRYGPDGAEEARYGPWETKDGAYHDLCTNPANEGHDVEDRTA